MMSSSSHGMNFRRSLLRIGQEMSGRDLINLKFACRSVITESRMDSVTSPKDVFLILEEKGLLSIDKLDYITRQLIDIGRPQLLSHFESFGFHIPSDITPLSTSSSSIDSNGLTANNDSQFNRILLAISQKLTSEEVDRLAFAWCGTHLSITPDKIETAHQLFTLMSQRLILTPDNLQVLYIECSEMGRQDLCRLIEDYFHTKEFGRHYNSSSSTNSGYSFYSPSPSPCPSYSREDSNGSSPFMSRDQFYNRPTNLDLSYHMSQLHLTQPTSSSPHVPPTYSRKESNATDNNTIAPPTDNCTIAPPTDNYTIAPPTADQFRPLSASNDGGSSQVMSNERSLLEERNALLAIKQEELISLQRQLELERAQKQPTDTHIQEIQLLQETLRAKNSEVNELREVITQLPQLRSLRTGDLYPMNKTPHGICLIINNYKFYQVEEHYELLTDRSGAQRDQENLIETFNMLQYSVELHENLTSEGMVDIFKDISSRDHTNYDSFVCCILTHGEEGQVFGADCKPVNLQDLTGIMKATFTRSLLNKPKLFFVQACRGDGEEKGVPIEKDGNPSLPVEADFLFGYATPTGKAAYRSRRHGSWFISELCQVFSQDSRRLPLGAMMKKVNCKVSDAYTKEGYKQCTEVVDRLRKDVLFFPSEREE